MFGGVIHANVKFPVPTKIELCYSGTTYVDIGAFAQFDLSVDPVTTPGDPNGQLKVQYYRISIKLEAVQTGTAELSALSDAGQLHLPVGVRATYHWGTFTITRDSPTFIVAFAFSAGSDEGSCVLRGNGDLIVSPSTFSSMISVTS